MMSDRSTRGMPARSAAAIVANIDTFAHFGLRELENLAQKYQGGDEGNRTPNPRLAKASSRDSTSVFAVLCFGSKLLVLPKTSTDSASSMHEPLHGGVRRPVAAVSWARTPRAAGSRGSVCGAPARRRCGSDQLLGHARPYLPEGSCGRRATERPRADLRERNGARRLRSCGCSAAVRRQTQSWLTCTPISCAACPGRSHASSSSRGSRLPGGVSILTPRGGCGSRRAARSRSPMVRADIASALATGRRVQPASR